jgi:hypothetical protein
MLEAARAWLVVDLRRSYPGSQKRKARMSFNDLAKKEVADKKASQEKDPKPQAATKRPPESKTESTDPKTG